MSIIAIITGVIKLITMFFSAKLERDKEKKAEKESIKKELSDGIKAKDTSLINAAIGRANRMR